MINDCHFSVHLLPNFSPFFCNIFNNVVPCLFWWTGSVINCCKAVMLKARMILGEAEPRREENHDSYPEAQRKQGLLKSTGFYSISRRLFFFTSHTLTLRWTEVTRDGLMNQLDLSLPCLGLPSVSICSFLLHPYLFTFSFISKKWVMNTDECQTASEFPGGN